MSSPEPSSSTTDATAGDVREPEDPFREPAYVIFAYTAWAAVTWFVGPRAGLAALVAAALLLLVAGALHAPRSRGVPSFNDDLALILLYCCAAIGAGVLVVGALA
jgi:nitrate reductase gamma subunit